MREDEGSSGRTDTGAVRVAEPERAEQAHPFRERAAVTVEAVRFRLAALTWALSLGAAIVLSSGALLIALGANTDNGLVDTVLDLARAVDGPFWRVFDFTTETRSGRAGPPDVVKNHLVNWGLAAAAYLLVGRLISNLIRPGRPHA
jgi:hypothetical protein